MDHVIEYAARGSGHYEGLKRLWCETFGDDPEFVDAFYDCFGDDIAGHVVLDENGEVCSAITCYPAGTYGGKTVYVSYAICTREDCRGQGLAGALTRYVKDDVISRGGISLVSPAERSLEDFYAELGYEAAFHAAPRAVLSGALDDEDEDDEEGFDFGSDEYGGKEAERPEADLKKIDASLYNKYREAYLSEVPHIVPSDQMLSAAALASEGFYSINGGDAVCCVRENERGRLVLSELIICPVLLDLSGEIDSVIAGLLADHFGVLEVVYNMPGAGRVQSMTAGAEDAAAAESEYENEDALPYFGFPIE